MKRITTWLLLALMLCLAAVLGGCGETPLQKAATHISENEALMGKCFIGYDSEKDFLTVTVIDDCDLDAVFEALNADIQDQEIGGILFNDETHINSYYHSLNEDLQQTYAEKIGGITCASLGTLGIAGNTAENSDGAWTAAAANAGKVWMSDMYDVTGYKDDALNGLKNIRVLQIPGTSIGAFGCYPNLEELDICTDLKLNAEDATNSTDETNTADATDATENTAEDSDADSKADQGEAGDGSGEEAAEKPYEFDYEYDNDANMFRTLKEAEKLQRLLIAPNESSWKMTTGAAGYIFAVCNVRPELMMNPPDQEFSEENLVRADAIDVSLLDEPVKDQWGKEQDKTPRQMILLDFLDDETEPTYKKAVKLKEKSKEPKIKGKALVYITDPYQYSESDWPSKRQWNSDGKILMEEIEDKIPIPERSEDYDTFVYGYPTFKKVGSYTSGTAAYSQTYYVQVFDLKNKVAYEAQTVGTAQPEKQFSYSGKAPSKHSGVVKEKKIIKFIKKIKTED